MTSSNLLQKYRSLCKEFDALYQSKEAQALARIIIERVTGMKAHDALATPNLQLTHEQGIELECYVSELKLQKPIQYILGETEFFGIRLKVNQNVLIPRPETEELVEWVLKTNTLESPSVLDIGTGSGAIAIALAKNISKASVFALDISPEAIGVATKNASDNEVNITFIEQDILVLPDLILGSPFDIIVSNPPYVRESEKNMMQPNVLDNEPRLALFVNDANPLQFYKTISIMAKRHLNRNGYVFCEINEAFGTQTATIFQEMGFVDVTIRRDINGKERMVSGKRA